MLAVSQDELKQKGTNGILLLSDAHMKLYTCYYFQLKVVKFTKTKRVSSRQYCFHSLSIMMEQQKRKWSRLMKCLLGKLQCLIQSHAHVNHFYQRRFKNYLCLSWRLFHVSCLSDKTYLGIGLQCSLTTLCYTFSVQLQCQMCLVNLYFTDFVAKLCI